MSLTDYYCKHVSEETPHSMYACFRQCPDCRLAERVSHQDKVLLEGRRSLERAAGLFWNESSRGERPGISLDRESDSAPVRFRASSTPRTDALLLQINEGRVYKDEGPLADLCRELESSAAELVEALQATKLESENAFGLARIGRAVANLESLLGIKAMGGGCPVGDFLGGGIGPAGDKVARPTGPASHPDYRADQAMSQALNEGDGSYKP